MRRKYALGWRIFLVVTVLIFCAGCNGKGPNAPADAGVATDSQGDTKEPALTEPEGSEAQTTAERETTAKEASSTEEETTTQEPDTEETAEALTTEASSEAEAESTTQEPTTQEPATQEPTTEEPTTEEPTTQESTTPAPTLSYEERQQLMRQLISQELPGILCWGDSLTAGHGGNGVSYPGVLSELLNIRLIDGIEVLNFGVSIETTYTIMARANVVPLYAFEFVIPAGCYPAELEVVTDYGMYLNLAASGDGGLNPVTIAGVKGILKFVRDKEDGGKLYSFTRLEPGETVEVPGMTAIIPDSVGKYSNYVNVVFMGQNGTYDGYEDLVNLYRRFADSFDNDRYIFIGLTTDTAERRQPLEALMTEAFGDKYINMRAELVNRGTQLLGIPENDEDAAERVFGKVPVSLLSDEVHLNEYGYRAMAYIIYERMEQLGYFDGVKGILAEYNY